MADTYFGSERDLIRIDMSEYMEKSSVTRLTGPPPGLVGYEEGGQLTEAVRRSPHSVVLLDELEKAHGDVLNLLLQVLEDGILTDGKGRTISFKNTVLIMTSNIGSKKILKLVGKHHQENTRARHVGLSDTPSLNGQSDNADNSDLKTDQIEYTKLARVVKGELERSMKPEFLNRIDDIVVFQPLTENELSMIAMMMVLEITIRAKMEKDLDITVSNELFNRMVEEGSMAASQFGARPMRRAVQRILEDAISDAVVKNFVTDGDVANFGVLDKTLGSSALLDPAPLVVAVTRSRDDEILEVPIEESSRDLMQQNDEEEDWSDENNKQKSDMIGALEEEEEDKEYVFLEESLQ